MFSERTTRQILDVLIALRDGRNPADLPDAAAAELANYWDKLGLLTRGGHIARKLMWNFVDTGCQVWWATLAPFVKAVRAKWADPTLWEHFEWLAGVMQEMDRRSLRVEQALRTVIVASPDNVTVGQPAPTTPPAAA